MSTNLVIVAIPEENDRVWKVSSEKVPHLTLLFLGEAESNPHLAQIVQFVEHATTLSEHGQFYLDVDHRGTLGDAEADVLFFSKRSWNLKWIKQFRGQLLQNQQIRSAYDGAQQHDPAPQEWEPHLTLGYPDTPANPIPDDGFMHPIYSVCFDRIAVWVGDYEGPEFRLEWPEREMEGDLAVAYSDEQKKALKHFGTKGMKWGRRKTETVTVGDKTKMVTPKKAAKLDKKWEKNQFTLPKGIERHNAMAEHFNQRIGALNDKFAKDDFSKETFDSPATWTPRFKEYSKAIDQLHEASFRHAVEKVHGSSPTGKKKVVVVGEVHDDTMRIVVKPADNVKHAAVENDGEVFLFKITRNANGLITNVEPLEDSMSQTAELGEEFLEHLGVETPSKSAEYGEVFVEGLMHGATSASEEFILEHFGIKGMRWGFRKDKPAAPISSKSTRTFTGKAKVDTEGGHGHPAHEDAIKVAEARTKLKKSGPAALSNSELREVANRLQLENQVDVLTSSKARVFVSRQLENEGQNLARQGVREGVKRSFKRGAKVAGTAAAVAA